MLKIEAVARSFGGFKAVSDVSLEVRPGEIVAVIGPNGAGKSTLFHLITGHLQPNAGRVLLEGKNITGMEPHRIQAMGMGRSFQHANIFARLTVFENIQAALLVHALRGGGSSRPVWPCSWRHRFCRHGSGLRWSFGIHEATNRWFASCA